MTIKGLRVALAKKQAQRLPQQQDTDCNAKVAKPRLGDGPVQKPPKKVTGRGR